MRGTTRSLLLVSALLMIAAGIGCSNLTAPRGEDPDHLPPVEGKAQPRPLTRTPSSAEAPPTAPAAVQRILVAFQGAPGAKPTVTRTKEEARKLIADLSDKLEGGGADFATLAKEHSDAPEAATGGVLPPFRPDSDVSPSLKASAFRLKVGEVSGVLTAPEGFMLIKRIR